jgi:hypothetical protein
MSDTDRSLNEWADLCEDYRPLYQAFVERLERVIRDLPYDADLAYEQVWAWTSDVHEFSALIARLRREGQDFENPLEELTEWAGVGVRVVGHSEVKAATDAIRGALVTEDPLLTARLGWER